MIKQIIKQKQEMDINIDLEDISEMKIMKKKRIMKRKKK